MNDDECWRHRLLLVDYWRPAVLARRLPCRRTGHRSASGFAHHSIDGSVGFKLSVASLEMWS